VILAKKDHEVDTP